MARVGGDVQLAGWRVSGGRAPSGRKWNGSQSGQGATELGFPGPAVGKMQGEAARRAGEPSGQGEEPPPEGLGGDHLLAQTDARRPPGQVVGHHLYRQPSAVGGEAPRGEMVQADAILEVADGILDLGVAAMISLQLQGLPVPVGDEAVIAVAGEERQLGTGRGPHPPDDEPHRHGVRLGLEWGVELVSEVFSRANVVIKTASNYGRLLVGNIILSSLASIIRMSLWSWTSETGSFHGSRRMKASLVRQGLSVSRKRVQRLMRIMGLRAIYRQPRTSQPAPERRVYPYLLRDLTITRADQVWAADITYLPMARGFLYLVAIMDWHSRYVVAWGLSNTLEAGFCAEALTEALGQGRPDVFNTDQGSQFTSREFTQILQDHSVKISMDGRGRYQDDILVERLWRTVKYEEVYLKAYANGLEARRGLREYFRFYNHRRPHQALGYRTPAEVFHGEPVEKELKERRCPDQRVLVSYGGVQESHLIVA